MYTKEKRAQLEARGEEWPECCGEPMSWWRSPGMVKNGRFRCKVWNRERMAAKRAERRNAGVCVGCGGKLETESLCADCAESHRDASWKHDQGIERQLHQRLHKMRKRAEKRDVTGVIFEVWHR